MSEKFQLHVSALNMISKCGIQFEFRYLQNLRLPPGMSLIIGTAVDKAVTADLGNKISTGQLLPAEQVKDIARDALAEEFDRGVQFDDEFADAGPQAAKAAGIDASVRLSDLHHREAAPKIRPTHVQRAWVMDVEGLPVQIAGTIDIQEGVDSIRDTKTSGKSPAADVADTSLQLTTYALAVKIHDGAPPRKVALDYLVRTKVPKLVQIESTRGDKDFPHLLERIYQASRMIEAGLFMPAPIDAWWCQRKWCGYWNVCKYAARPATVGA